jgi:hypothetical protein
MQEIQDSTCDIDKADGASCFVCIEQHLGKMALNVLGSTVCPQKRLATYCEPDASAVNADFSLAVSQLPTKYRRVGDRIINVQFEDFVRGVAYELGISPAQVALVKTVRTQQKATHDDHLEHFTVSLEVAVNSDSRAVSVMSQLSKLQNTKEHIYHFLQYLNERRGRYSNFIADVRLISVQVQSTGNGKKADAQKNKKVLDKSFSNDDSHGDSFLTVDCQLALKKETGKPSGTRFALQKHLIIGLEKFFRLGLHHIVLTKLVERSVVWCNMVYVYECEVPYF